MEKTAHKLKTVPFDLFLSRLRSCLGEATNHEICTRIFAREHKQLAAASWLLIQRVRIAEMKGEYWESVPHSYIVQIAKKLRMLTDRDDLEPLFMINLVVAASYPSVTFENIILRVSSREIVKALLISEKDYRWVKDNYDIELTRSRRKR